jgi:hypothetical protein
VGKLPTFLIIKEFGGLGYNGVLLGIDGYVNYRNMPEDKVKLTAIKQIIENQIKVAV